MASASPSRLGKYDLVARIAKGGMAEIYLARQRGMVGFSRLVVVKRILPHLAEEIQFVQMFMEEARLAAQISHPNVVQIFDVGQFEGSYYMAMEFINGPSLGVICRESWSRRAPLPWAVAGEIVAQACAGLHAAHELRDETGTPFQLVHRDISPHNLMISTDGVVKLVDFGIAKAQDSSVKTHTGKIKGKYPYMSPEQCRGDPLDRRTDIFSLGIVFYELIVGRRLFQRATDLMILKAITEEQIAPPHEQRAGIPLQVSQLIMTALERDPDDRFSSAAEMESEMRRLFEELEVKSSPRSLAVHLTEEYRALIDQRTEAIQSVIQLKPTGEEPPVVGGFEAGSQVSSKAPPTYTPGTFSIPDGIRRRFPAKKLLLFSLVVLTLSVGGGLLLRHVRKPSRPSGPTLTWGIPPNFPAAITRKELGPFLRYVEQRVSRPVDLVVTKDYRSARLMLLSGKAHVAILPAMQFVLARSENPDIAILATQTIEGASSYQSYLIVGDRSEIKTLEDLRGKRFCYADSGSTSGYLLPRYFLRRRGLDPGNLFASTRFSGNHFSVMKDIIAGRCDAGAVYSMAFLGAGGHGVAASRLQVLAVAGKIPYDAICVSRKLSAELAGKIKRALLELDPRRDLGKRMIGKTFRIDGFVKPLPEVFSTVERAARDEGLIK